jgi:hypothetical protein
MRPQLTDVLTYKVRFELDSEGLPCKLLAYEHNQANQLIGA